MNRTLLYFFSVLMFITAVSVSSCGRSSTRAVSLWPGDRNVTVAKRKKYHGVKGRRKAVTTTKYNRNPAKK